jgi:DNA-binding NtrC family response regulator
MKKILIVDDQQLLLYGLEKALKTEATEVTVSETGAAALSRIASSPYDLCFLDVFLPDMNGVDILKRVKELCPSTRVIMMTAGTITDSMKENIEKNAYMFITKPFDLLQVKMLAQRALEIPPANAFTGECPSIHLDSH